MRVGKGKRETTSKVVRNADIRVSRAQICELLTRGSRNQRVANTIDRAPDSNKLFDGSSRCSLTASSLSVTQ